MYCIRIKADVDSYVCGCNSGSFRLCDNRSDAKQFDSITDLLQCTKSIGLRYEDFEVESTGIKCEDSVIKSTSNNEGQESSVFSGSCDDIITFERLAEICGSSTAMSRIHPGDKVEKRYIVIAAKPDAVKIWSPNNHLVNMNWLEARTAAADFYKEWNNFGFPIEAISSELLSKEEAEAISESNRATGVNYWTSTEYSSGVHWLVYSDGSLNFINDSCSVGCCPGIWVGVSMPSRSKNVDVLTFERLHEICEEGSADLLLKPGDKLEKGYIIVAVKPDAVKIWSVKNNAGDMDWTDAMNVAVNYFCEWNKDRILPVQAVSSELLSKEELEDLSPADRRFGIVYWAATRNDSGSPLVVYYDGSLHLDYDKNSYSCCPGIWVR